MTTLADLRKDYARGSLDETSVDADPIAQFEAWFKQAQDARLPEPNTMTLATVDARGCPSARIVLIKGVDARGFVFFTNYESRKGQDLAANPHACLLFYWIELERQVRIEGTVEKTNADESDRYFNSRPLGSRIGAWASDQSRRIESRAWLEAREKAFAERFGEHPPRPPHWGGYRLVPQAIEFWQGRPSRLHDRILYTRQSESESESGWRLSRLSP